MKLRLITLAFISVFFLTAASAKKKTTAPVNNGLNCVTALQLRCLKT